MVVPYRHEYVLMVAWVVTCLVALLALLLVGARAAGWDLLGSAAGSALLGSMAGALAGVLASPDPDGFPGLAVPGAIVGAITLGLVGLFFNATGGRADPIARRVKAGLSGIPVVGLLVLLYFSAASEVVLGGRDKRRTVPATRSTPTIPSGNSRGACRSSAYGR